MLKDSIVKWILSDRKGGFWRHTRETASVLYGPVGICPGPCRKPRRSKGEHEPQWPGTGKKINVASPHFCAKTAFLRQPRGGERIGPSRVLLHAASR